MTQTSIAATSLYFLPRGRDSLAHQGLQAVWKNDRLSTTALLHQPRIARVRYRLITKLQFRGVYGTTNNRFVAGMTEGRGTRPRIVKGP